MKKRAKKSFVGISRNAIFAILILAAAVTVYGITEAAIVSHPPRQIQPQGAEGGFDAATLTGLSAADILSQVQIPAGMIAMFDTSCPEGWTRFAALDNRFPQGAATYGGTGGASTHSHPFSGITASETQTPPGGIERQTLSPVSMAGHTHDFSGNTGSGSNLPPYLNVIWCKKN